MSAPVSVRPWWKQPWPWLLIALPGSMVVISFGLLGVALRNSDDIVNQHPYETGLKIGQVVIKARNAAAMHLWGKISYTAGTVTVHLQPAPDDETLKLHLEHPFSSAQDLDGVMNRIAPGVYEVALPVRQVQYSAQLQTAQWSLSGRWKPGDEADLLPGVSQPTGAAPRDE